jgi:hypothetical protein
MEDSYDFEIFVNNKRKVFRMEVTKIYDGYSVERFKIKGGRRHIILESNRPFLLKQNSKKKIQWSIKEGDLKSSKPTDAADAVSKIVDQIEKNIVPQPVSKLLYIRSKK